MGIVSRLVVDTVYWSLWSVTDRSWTLVDMQLQAGEQIPPILSAHQRIASGLWKVDAEQGRIYSERTYTYLSNEGAFETGYVYVCPAYKSKVQAHKVIWEYVNGPIPKGLEVDHQDNDRANNRLDNLQLVTHKRNCELAAIRRRERLAA